MPEIPREDLTVRLAAVKEQMLKNPNFLETLKYFHDQLADHDWFLSKKVCHAAKPDLLELIVRAALDTFFKKERVKISSEVFVRVRGTPFYHGSFKAQHYICSVIYFADIGAGIVAFASSADPQTHTMRITSKVLGPDPRWN